MRYGLTLLAIGDWPFLEFSREAFEELRTSQRSIGLLLSIEEKFDALLQNFVEYELELLHITLGHTVFQTFEWGSVVGDLHRINRRLANVLSLGRVYTDHVKHDCGALFGKGSPTHSEFKEQFRTAYDRCLGYRVMEELRNYTQHQSFPITHIKYPTSWVDHGTPQAAMRSSIVVAFHPRDLQDTFKPLVRAELEKEGSHDVTASLRSYIEQFGIIHEFLRQRYSEHLAIWREHITTRITSYDQLGAGHLGLAAVAEDNGDWVERTMIFTEPLQRLDYLRNKNRLLTNLARRYVSSRIAV